RLVLNPGSVRMAAAWSGEAIASPRRTRQAKVRLLLHRGRKPEVGGCGWDIEILPFHQSRDWHIERVLQCLPQDCRRLREGRHCDAWQRSLSGGKRCNSQAKWPAGKMPYSLDQKQLAMLKPWPRIVGGEQTTARAPATARPENNPFPCMGANFS